MTTKVILNAQAVRELISLDEGPVMEIAKNAVAQVAKRLGEDLVNKPIEEALNHRISLLLTSGGSRNYMSKLNEGAQKALTEHLKQATEAFISKLATQAIREEIRVLVREALAVEVAARNASLPSQIDALIRERFAAAFGLKN
jgi:hypothetical protein